MIELNLVVLFILFAALFFILMSLFLYLIIKKYMNNRTKQKIKDYKKDYYEDVFQFLQTGEQGLIQFDQKLEKFKAMIELLIEYSTVLDDSSVKMRISNFAKQHLTTYVKKELRKRRWSLRMNALYLIEDFHMDNLVEILHELYKKKRTTVAEKTQILKLLAQFDDEKIVEYVKTVSTQISDFSLLSIMTSLEEEKFEVLIEEFDALPIRIKYIVVETIGRKQLFKHQNLLQRLVLQDEGELRIRALKAYATTGLPIDSNVIAGFFHSENWQFV